MKTKNPKYYEIKFDLVINKKNPTILCEFNFQFNGEKISSAFDAISNMNDLIVKAWNNLSDSVKKNLQGVFKIVGEVTDAIDKLAGDAKKAFNEVSDWIKKKNKFA